MQVKKFEAKTMREALKMIKEELGPEAIILRVKDNSRRYGLMNQSTVEVTAAVASPSLQKKKIVDYKFGEKAERLADYPAQMQREFIDKYIHHKIEEKKHRPRPGFPGGQVQKRYVDIMDDDSLGEAQVSPNGEHSLNPGSRVKLPANGSSLSYSVSSPGNIAKERIQEAARSAWDAVQHTLEDISGVRGSNKSKADQVIQGLPGVELINELRSEISRLNSVIQTLQKPASTPGAFPGALYGLPYELSAMFEKLMQMGFSEGHSAMILGLAKAEVPPTQLKKPALVKAWIAKYLLQNVDVVDNPFDGWMHVFVGPSGGGKTTTLVKFCSQLIVGERKKVVVITTDTSKVGAIEQLRIYAQILNAPFAIIRRPQDWHDLHHELQTYDAILVDTPGLQLKDNNEVQSLLEMLPPSGFNARVHYVASATAKDDEMEAAARRYQPTRFRDVIFTNIDEAVNFGNIYNFQKDFKVPLGAFAMGPRIPEDLEPATKERYIDLVFKLTNGRDSLGSRFLTGGEQRVER